MGTTYHNKPIVTDGLVFYVDAANKESYPGSGTTATDIISNTSTTLQSSGMFENVNAGVFSFDGGTNSINCGDNNIVKPSGAMTIEYWFKGTSASVNASGIGTMGNNGSRGYFFYNGVPWSGDFNGEIGPISFYKSKALSASEVLHNYNALKGRFGL